MGLAKEFKEFAMKGNVVDMAVGIIIGAAFGKIVSALVGSIVMPAIGMIVGGVDFSTLSVGSHAAKVREPRQVRKEAAVSDRLRVPWGDLAGAGK